jgi:hypothetical protein
MNTYKVKFRGREAGAIGIFYQIETTVQGKNEKDALLKLYEKYDHISFPRFEEVTE